MYNLSGPLCIHEQDKISRCYTQVGNKGVIADCNTYTVNTQYMYNTIHRLYKPTTLLHTNMFIIIINKQLQALLNAINKYTTQCTHYTIVKLHNLGSQLSIALTQHASIAPRLPLSDEPQLHVLHFELLSVSKHSPCISQNYVV